MAYALRKLMATLGPLSRAKRSISTVSVAAHNVEVGPVPPRPGITSPRTLHRFMTHGFQPTATGLARPAGWLDHGLAFLAAYGIPLLVACLSVLALAFAPSQYPSVQSPELGFRALSDPSGTLEPEQALQALRTQPPLTSWDTRLSQDPVWSLVDLSALSEDHTVLSFPSRHSVQVRCWSVPELALVGEANRSGLLQGMQTARGGFALPLPVQAQSLLCRSTFLGPARLTLLAGSQAHLQVRELQFQRNAGLLDGGILILAIFTLMAGLINRSRSYLVFAAWLVINLRMAGLSGGWDTQWLGQTIPFDWLIHLRPLTLALYYVVTFALFTALFEEELKTVGHRYLITAAKWTCLPLIVLALTLPYGLFLPILWVSTGLGIAILVFVLSLMLLRTPSRVAVWYALSIGVALFASLYEVVAAALGLKGLIGTINSTSAALSSSLLASLAIAEQMRQEHQARILAQEELTHAYAVIPIGLFTLDTQGRFVSSNPALLDMLDKPTTGPDFDRWSQHFGEAEWERLQREMATAQPVEYEMSVGAPLDRRLLLKATRSGDKVEGSLQDITEKARATEHLQFLANHDTLTKVLNRRGIEAKLQTGLYRLSRGQPLSVAYLDLDRFKLINDLYGHTAGDAVLQEICARAQAPLQAHMHLGRVGGDEFLIVMSDTPLARAEAVCRQILAHITGSPCQVGDRAFQVRGSIGLIEVGAGASAKDVVSTADHACREAKKDNVNGLVVYERGSKVFTEHEAELQLIERLTTQHSIEGLFLEMQPIMSLRQPNQSLNFEVLLRMKDAQGQRVPTDRLIRAGENAGRMGVIDRWVLTHTLEWLRTHGQALPAHQFVCMNLSGASLNDERFMEDAFELLQRYPEQARKLCLEVTESVALHDMGNTRFFIERVRQFGAKVALDDFGAGYTSFSYLKDLPADLLKIDGSFIVDMNRHPANIAIVEAIVSLAQNLGMKTIAEWAEDAATVETLAEIGVDYVQGFIVSRPQSPERLLNAASAAHFIEDAQLLHYLSDLNSDDGLRGVDLVLGTSPPSPP
jgi:diguanylate cyclase (GGDEF)-like protein